MKQFGARICLRCVKADAENFMGSSAPSLLPKRGQCYSNESSGENQETTRRWVIPHIPENVIKEHLPIYKQLAKSNKCIDRNAKFYSEDKLHYEEELLALFKEYPEFCGGTELNFRTIFLGERTDFNSTSDLPINFTFIRDNNESICIAGDSLEMLVNLINTFIVNLKCKSIPYMINCKNKDASSLLDLPNKVSENFLPFLDYDLCVEEILESLVEIVDNRNQDSNILFIFLLFWESAELTYKQSDVLKKLLRIAPKTNLHFIVVTREPKQLNDLMSCCTHKIGCEMSDTKNSDIIFADSITLFKNIAGYKRGNILYKFKVYQHPLVGSVLEREVKMKRSVK